MVPENLWQRIIVVRKASRLIDSWHKTGAEWVNVWSVAAGIAAYDRNHSLNANAWMILMSRRRFNLKLGTCVLAEINGKSWTLQLGMRITSCVQFSKQAWLWMHKTTVDNHWDWNIIWTDFNRISYVPASGLLNSMNAVKLQLFYYSRSCAALCQGSLLKYANVSISRISLSGV